MFLCAVLLEHQDFRTHTIINRSTLDCTRIHHLSITVASSHGIRSVPFISSYYYYDHYHYHDYYYYHYHHHYHYE